MKHSSPVHSPDSFIFACCAEVTKFKFASQHPAWNFETHELPDIWVYTIKRPMHRQLRACGMLIMRQIYHIPRFCLAIRKKTQACMCARINIMKSSRNRPKTVRIAGT